MPYRDVKGLTSPIKSRARQVTTVAGVQDVLLAMLAVMEKMLEDDIDPSPLQVNRPTGKAEKSKQWPGVVRGAGKGL